MKKGNSLFIILLISTFAHCQNIGTKVSGVNKIKEIQIESVDFSIMTFLSVGCDEFEEYFKKYETVSITNDKRIDELLRCLTTLNSIDSTYSKNVDTRAKIKLLTENDSSVICVGNLTLSMSGNIYKTPEELINFIENLE